MGKLILTCTSGSVDISPVRIVEMGCGPNNQEISGADPALEVNILAFFDEHNEEIFLIISIDALYVGEELRKKIETYFFEKILSKNIFFAASHTHYAPQVDFKKQNLGRVDVEHFNHVCNLILELINELLLAPREPFEILYGSFISKNIISRRKFRWIGGQSKKIKLKKYFFIPNKKSLENTEGHIVKLICGGKALAYIWQLPCHPTSLPFNFTHSSHYPGVIRNKLRAREKRKIPVIFLQGFSGELRPPSVAKPKSILEFFRLIILGRWFTDFSKNEFDEWNNSIFLEMIETLQSEKFISSKYVPENIEAIRREIDLNQVVQRGEHSSKVLTIHLLNFEKINIFGISAEVTSPYAKYLKSISGDNYTIPVGCIDDTFGYLPTDLMIKQGGYESEISLKLFNLKCYNHFFEQKIKNLITEVLTSHSNDVL
jgi:hypothetical protein